MLLTPTELERLTIFTAAELARKRRARGRLLNAPEAVALICDDILEGARDGRSVAYMISFGSTILTCADVMPGVAALIPMIQVEGVFPDGTKLVTVHDPIRAVAGGAAEDIVCIPGEIRAKAGRIEINVGRRKADLVVLNTGDRPVQIGSHFHFFGKFWHAPRHPRGNSCSVRAGPKQGRTTGCNRWCGQSGWAQ
jgi:urease subunit gamma/beta